MEPRTELDAHRIATGETWDSLGHKCGLSGETIRAIGSGRRVPSTITAHRIATTLGVSVSPCIPATTGTDARERLSMAAERAREIAQRTPHLEDHRLLEGDLRDLASAYPVTPLPALINPLVDLADSIHAAIDEPRHGDSRRLYSLGAMSAAMLAKASHDLGEPRSANTQVRAAQTLADRAENVELRAWLDGLASFFYYWQGRPRDALRHAQRGLATIQQSGTTALWLTANQLRAAGQLGDASLAVATGQRTQAIADGLSDTDTSELDDFGGIFNFTAPRALYYAADGLAWLPPEATDTTETGYASTDAASLAVELYSNPREEYWAFGDAAGARCAQAIDSLRHGDVEEAQSTLAPVFDMPREQRIHGVISSAQRVSRALANAPASAAHNDLADQLDNFIAAPLVMTP